MWRTGEGWSYGHVHRRVTATETRFDHTVEFVPPPPVVKVKKMVEVEVGPDGQPLIGGGQPGGTMPPDGMVQPPGQAAAGMPAIPGLTMPLGPPAPAPPGGIPGAPGGRAPGAYPGLPPTPGGNIPFGGP